MSNTMNTFAKADQALPMLQRIASLVKPIMRKHGWVLPVLSEFFPESPNLVDINGGQKILLRLRPAHAPDTFYDEEDIVHTMLHELTHNVHGPHDEKFYKFLAGLEEEYAVLKRSGYAGEGFFTKGQRLGTNVSHNLPPHLARQRALDAAEKRRQINAVLGGGGKLGGARGTVNKSPRELAAEAAERRMRDEKACASGAVAQMEAEKAAKESVVNRVIDLTVESDSDTDSDVEVVDGPQPVAGPSKASNPINEARNATKRPLDKTSSANLKRSRTTQVASSAASTSALAAKIVPTEWSCPQCTLVNEAHLPHCAACDFASPADADRPRQTDGVPGALHSVGEWACPQCTLMNKAELPRCLACDGPRPTNNRSVKRVQPETEGWTCTLCGEAGMRNDFWSCSFCGSIKTQS
ncbi:WLM domain-containing protein [Fomitopsis serialis]|uniref:WLM domain-containing protein n=1 Tax=Fomitopsis serialis TaxID=139415 RepID=UPI0020075AF6|nr:WLM domain-containing protein [Neoantrodia serialis]KAH9929760.1 WLM domain-containing protein [Neoantrodia serialis]